MKNRVFAILFVCLLFTCAAAESLNVLYTGSVTKDMTIRKTKSTSAAKLGEVHPGDEIRIVSFDEKWTKIVQGEVTGYILSKNVSDLASAEPYDDAAAAQYTGVAEKNITVRRTKSKTGQPLQRIEAGEKVYITSLEEKWMGVVKHGIQGYILTEAVTGLAPAKEGVTVPEAYVTGPAFESVYTAVADLGLHIRRKKDINARSVGSISENERVEVMMIEGDWAYVRKGSTSGYVLSSHLKHYRRSDPYGPVIPGTMLCGAAAVIREDVQLYEAETGSLLRTLPAGAVVAIYGTDEAGNLRLPYQRKTAVIRETMKTESEEAASWAEAEDGQLLSVFSTYYDPDPTSAIQQGRAFNIMEGIRRINGIVIEPQEEFSFNAHCAPYTKGNGYELGPIINYVSSQKTGYSGGICQVSTTLYNAVLQIPFEIVRQQVHSSYGIFYAPLDMDAAVGAGNLDLRIRNVLPYRVRICAETLGGVVTIRIYRES